ncbi:hypothetical protein GCM10027074_50320 [Streptomyces deserti]
MGGAVRAGVHVEAGACGRVDLVDQNWFVRVAPAAGPGFTLRTYTHLLPSSETRTRKAIDDAFTEDEGGRPGAQGISVPPEKPMCPQCALAA